MPAAAPRLDDFARRVLTSDRLADKLAEPPAGTSDAVRGPAVRVDAPGRPEALRIRPGREVSVPPLAGFADPAQRVRLLHALANHELQAVELFAWALLAFPDAPDAFRTGCLQILGDEQRHLRLYMERIEALGAHFGAFPVSGHFWRQMEDVTSPLAFVCVLGLTFENANLDFAGDLIDAAEACGDSATADVLRTVHADEIRHVAFGWQWFERWRKGDAWTAYTAALGERLAPERARGRRFDRAAREQAGLAPEFVERLAATPPRAPGGARR